MPAEEFKLLPRNVAARRFHADASAAAEMPAGNPVATLLESGVGNCFPGLECDLRNLERRFFPHLEFDIGQVLEVVAVDDDAVDAAEAAGQLDAATASTYRAISTSLSQRWRVISMEGDFGPLGQLAFNVNQLQNPSFGTGRLPGDPWTAVRLLKQGSQVRLTLRRVQGGATRTLEGARVAYLDPNGALADIFEVGELTQSLCSPWTHDFRDCLCFYWASNHPDIALPPRVSGSGGEQALLGLETHWERSDRSLSNPPVETPAGGGLPPVASSRVAEMEHHEINRDWQRFNFVLERREQLLPYKEREHAATPLADESELIAHLRFAAGVELAVMQEYLVANWSLRLPAAVTDNSLRSDLLASSAEIMRIAIGEMRHLRAVNAVLRVISPQGTFTPALAVASQIPDGQGGFRPAQQRALRPEVIDDFIEIEAPSRSVDSVYGRIAATLAETGATDEQRQAINTVMAEGEEHWETFKFIRVWLGRHQPADYLRQAVMVPAPASNAAQTTLQNRYSALLIQLHSAYSAGLPAGAATLNAAREAMLGPQGIAGAMEAVAAQGFLPTFAPLADPRFAPIGAPGP
jgi:hypothetical protein